MPLRRTQANKSCRVLKAHSEMGKETRGWASGPITHGSKSKMHRDKHTTYVRCQLYISYWRCKPCRHFPLVSQNLCSYNKNITFTLTLKRLHTCTTESSALFHVSPTTVNATQAYSYLREMDISKGSHCRHHRRTSRQSRATKPESINRKKIGQTSSRSYKTCTSKEHHSLSCPSSPINSHEVHREYLGCQQKTGEQQIPPPPVQWPAGHGKRATVPKYRTGLGSSFHVTYLLSTAFLHASLSTNLRPAARRVRRIIIRRYIKYSQLHPTPPPPPK